MFQVQEGFVYIQARLYEDLCTAMFCFDFWYALCCALHPVDRNYEDANGCSDIVWFHCTTSEKGDKSVANTETLLLLPPGPRVNEIIRDASSGDTAKSEPVRAMLSELTTKEFRAKFRCHFWGDISALSEHCNTYMLCDTYSSMKLEDLLQCVTQAVTLLCCRRRPG